jgi:hypothetical protein
MKEQIKHSRDRLRIRSPFVRTDSSRSYPDFTIVDADTGITWYWEHLGMLGASEYDEKWVAKQPWHRTNGILHESEAGRTARRLQQQNAKGSTTLKSRGWSKRSKTVGEVCYSLPSRYLAQRIASAPPSSSIILKNAALNQIGDVAQRRVGWSLFNFRLLGRSKLALEPIEQAIQHIALALVERGASMHFPGAWFPSRVGKDIPHAVECVAKVRGEPQEPRRDVEIAH